MFGSLNTQLLLGLAFLALQSQCDLLRGLCLKHPEGINEWVF